MIMSRTPLRISFVGGGTDFEDFYSQYPGQVLSTAIDKYFYIAASSRFDGMIKASYSETELVEKADQIKHVLIKNALGEAGIEKGIDIISLSDVPAQKTGLGLGASSSFSVGILNVLYNFLGKEISAKDLAEKACKIEIEKAGSPIGKQDQYAAAFGGMNIIKFNTDKTIEVHPLVLDPQIKENFQRHLLFLFTGRERSANVILAEQKQNIKQKFEFLKKISDIVPAFKSALEKGDFRQAGEILHQNWLLKKNLASGISNPQIDQMYQKAIDSGAFGGKILGAGGGGFLLVMAPPEKHKQIIESLKEYKQIPFQFCETGSEIVFRD